MADLSDFQLSEYQNISQAHFKTNEMIATFFRYYVLVMAIPITVVVSVSSAGNYGEMTGCWPQLVGILFLMIAAIGHSIGRYISGLKFKAVVYARKVNGIRKYFHEMSDSKLDTVLPTDTSKPSLTTQTDHKNIVLTFAIFTALYCSVGVIFLIDFIAMYEMGNLPSWLLAVAVLFIAIFAVRWDHKRYFCSREEKGIE